MEITHLRVFLNIERILHVSPDRQSRNVNCDNAVSLWAFKDMKLNQITFTCCDDSKFTEPHLEHHILTQEDFLSNHDKNSSGGPDISKIEIARVLPWVIICLVSDFATKFIIGIGINKR